MPFFDEKRQNERLTDLRKREEEALAHALSEKYGLQYIDLSRVSINSDALRLIPEETARLGEAAAFGRVGKKISLGVRNPNNPELKKIVGDLEKQGYILTLFMISQQGLDRAWSRYKDLSFATESKAGVLEISGTEIRRLLGILGTLDDARKLIEETLGLKKADRISRILETVLAGALKGGASDIHVEPEESYVRLRYRLDGVLTDILNLNEETYLLILSRIKLISGLKLNIKDRAQDGRFTVRIEEKDLEIRTSILPGAYGESIVLRLLDPSTLAVSMEKLGIEPKLFALLSREIARPNGMILNTGPTGSGKTTTLYSFLRTIHKPEIKIITIEDPIEYHLPGIVQTQARDKDYTFGKGLRSALRQDPDVIMVGEIRDEEVAETAVNAALTGHLVFSTLHTNNAAGTFPRLIDLGVSAKVIGSAVNVAMAQRLVRTLCETCKKEVPLKGKEKQNVERILAHVVDRSAIPADTSRMWQAVGCPACNGIGYKGRIGVFEAILMDATIEEIVQNYGSERQIADAAHTQGILTMEEDGVLKVLRGITTLEELARVVDIEEETKKAPAQGASDGGSGIL